MFGMGFTEIIFIAVIAIIFLGPDKLPEAMVQIAKFFNSFKKTVTEAKSTFENEIHMNELKEEAMSYKKALDSDISGFKNSLSNPLDDLNSALSDLKNDDTDTDSYKRGQKHIASNQTPNNQTKEKTTVDKKENAKTKTADPKKKKKVVKKSDTDKSKDSK